MKRFLCFLVLLGTFTIPFSSYAECLLTDAQKAMIADLTRLHKRHPDLSTARRCIVFREDSLFIYYENGHRAMFHTTDTIATVDTQEVVATDAQEVLSQHIGTEREKELFSELDRIWASVVSADELRPEQLVRADTIVEELFLSVPVNDIELATYNMIGLRGNRYLGTVEGLVLSSKAQATFYEGYIDSDASNMVKEDIPTDAQKREAIQKLVRVFRDQGDDKTYLFSWFTSEEIRRLDPSAYQILMKYGAISTHTPS